MPKPKLIQVVEFYNQSLDHYFITGYEAEIKALDDGTTLKGWKRTGYSFLAYPPGDDTPGSVAVARFYNAAQSTHFFTASEKEVRDVQSFFHDWRLETLEAFRVSNKNGTPVFRLFNNRTDANHRYTADTGVREEMIAKGYTLEGDSKTGVFYAPVEEAQDEPSLPKPTPQQVPARLSPSLEADMHVVQAVTAANAPDEYQRLQDALGAAYANYVALYGPGNRYWDPTAVSAAAKARQPGR